MADLERPLSWTRVFKVAPTSSKNLPGDKILLPQSALEELLAASTRTVSVSGPNNTAFDPFNPYSLAAARAQRSQWQENQQTLPQPLTFRLVNTANGNFVHAGIREFSAEENEIELSPFLVESLGLTLPTQSKSGSNLDVSGTYIDLTAEDEENAPRITVHASQLPKGRYVRLRPLEAGYNPEDWKSLLERHLRENYTTLTNGGILTVQGSKSEEFRFLIDKFSPEGAGICVVDTDLEVDIEALNEEQARETLKQITAKAAKTANGSSAGGNLNIWKSFQGQVLSGEYVDYQLPSWDRSQSISVELINEGVEGLQLLVSPHSPYQRARPREDEHVWGDFSNRRSKSITIQPSNVELENAEALFVSVYAPLNPEFESSHQFSLRIQSLPSHTVSKQLSNGEAQHTDEEKCSNCHQWIPKRTMMLHQNFCFRNNIPCPSCQQVFQKNSAEWKDHWHCPHDSEYGDTPFAKEYHDTVFHTTRICPNCPYEARNVKDLAAHRTTSCPGKIILCQFCHLEVPQEGDPFDPSPETIISGLTAHELADGARTTDCHLCSKIVRLRDMSTHLKHHELQKLSKPTPAICRNVNCGRTLDGVGKHGEIGAGSKMGQGPGNNLGLCSICFGPLYVSMHDPEGKAMKRRIERRYLAQLMSGCGKSWCQNLYCKMGKANGGHPETFTAQSALQVVKPLMDTTSERHSPMHFCVDEGSHKRRILAQLLAAEKVFELEWCVAALEAEAGNLDAARTWLNNWAPMALPRD